VVRVQEEKNALSAFYFFVNQIILHTFARFLPGVLFYAAGQAQKIMLNP
jgi:hypothetical protein